MVNGPSGCSKKEPASRGSVTSLTAGAPPIFSTIDVPTPLNEALNGRQYSIRQQWRANGRAYLAARDAVDSDKQVMLHS